ncbi:MAG: ABC transporter permease subunit [Actinobacteria bacterium]|nr:ABC transporter permease subunit [Actinomycetota bacterium]
MPFLSGRKLRRGGTRGNPLRVPWIVAFPSLAFTIAIHFLPVVVGLWYAFTDWDGLSPNANWIGLANFRTIFAHPATRSALWNTLLITGVFVVAVNVAGLALAVALNRSVKSRHVLRSLFFLPFVLMPLASGYIWRYIFDYTGVLNRFLQVVGLEEWVRPWFADPSTVLWTIVVVLIWQYSGLAMVFYLAGLQGVSDELWEAAAIDGASTWMRFRRITVPLLAPAFTVSLVFTTITGFRLFDQIIALTGGGPVYASETLATQVWKQSFVNGNFGLGSALALMLTGLIVVVAVTQLVVLGRREAAAA